MYDLAVDWYAGRTDEGWIPPTAEEATAIFASHGFTGRFWELE